MEREVYEKFTNKELKEMLRMRFPPLNGYIGTYGGWKKNDMIDALLGLKEVPINKNRGNQNTKSAWTKKELKDYISRYHGIEMDENAYTKKQLEEMFYKIVYPERFQNTSYSPKTSHKRSRSPPKSSKSPKKAKTNVEILHQYGIYTKKDYFNFLRKNHPDKNPNITEEQINDLIRVNEAYNNQAQIK